MVTANVQRDDVRQASRNIELAILIVPPGDNMPTHIVHLQMGWRTRNTAEGVGDENRIIGSVQHREIVHNQSGSERTGNIS